MRLKERKQNVLIVHNYYQIPGGEDTVVANEKKMLEDHGHKVVFYSRNNSEIEGMSKFQKLKLPFTTIFNPRTYTDIKKLIKKEKIDIVHVHNTLNLISPAVYYATINSNLPIIQTIHNYRLLCPGATFYRNGHICEDCIERSLKCALKYGCYRNSKAQTLVCVLNTAIHRISGVYGKINYICLTEFNKQKLCQFQQINSCKVHVKPNFSTYTSQNIIPYCDRENQFVFVGRLDKLKGIDLLLKAWKQIEQAPSENNPTLIICGDGSMKEWCQKFIESNQLKNVVFQGLVSNTEAKEIIAHSKALVLPTQWYEGFPMTIVEAYSVGTPVYGSKIGNVGSLIENEKTGLLFEGDSVTNISETIKCDISFDTTEIFQYYKERYTAEKNYKILMDIYTKCKYPVGI